MKTAIVVKSDEDNLSSSPVSAEVQAEIAALPAGELHGEILQTFVSLGEKAIRYQALVLDARRRMNNGEAVGGCKTWSAYVNAYFKRQDESLPSCLRRLRRALEGKNPDTKHKNRRTAKLGKKSARKILEESLDNSERLTEQAEKKSYDKGFRDGTKSLKQLAAKVAANKKAVATVEEKEAATVEKAVVLAEKYKGMLLTLIAAVEGGDVKNSLALAARMREGLTTAAERKAEAEARLKGEPSQNKSDTPRAFDSTNPAANADLAHGRYVPENAKGTANTIEIVTQQSFLNTERKSHAVV
jgi:hypothetical protein